MSDTFTPSITLQLDDCQGVLSHNSQFRDTVADETQDISNCSREGRLSIEPLSEFRGGVSPF